jgi:hypothetical protein
MTALRSGDAKANGELNQDNKMAPAFAGAEYWE